MGVDCVCYVDFVEISLREQTTRQSEKEQLARRQNRGNPHCATGSEYTP